MDNVRATHQDIRPMNVLILNLMPTKLRQKPALRLLPARPCRSM
ncbi:MAG: homoserine O-acetyltransferase/O-succinyltransferase family protein [Streptococcus sp.]